MGDLNQAAQRECQMCSLFLQGLRCLPVCDEYLGDGTHEVEFLWLNQGRVLTVLWPGFEGVDVFVDEGMFLLNSLSMSFLGV